MSASHETTFIVPVDHPTLPGHFPGNPVVPGVVVLDRVLTAADAWLGRTVEARLLKQAKFHSPLLPDETARLLLELTGKNLSFRVLRDDQPVAQGTFSLADFEAA